MATVLSKFEKAIKLLGTSQGFKYNCSDITPHEEEILINEINRFADSRITKLRILDWPNMQVVTKKKKGKKQDEEKFLIRLIRSFRKNIVTLHLNNLLGDETTCSCLNTFLQGNVLVKDLLLLFKEDQLQQNFDKLFEDLEELQLDKFSLSNFELGKTGKLFFKSCCINTLVIHQPTTIVKDDGNVLDQALQNVSIQVLRLMDFGPEVGYNLEVFESSGENLERVELVTFNERMNIYISKFEGLPDVISSLYKLPHFIRFAINNQDILYGSPEPLGYKLVPGIKYVDSSSFSNITEIVENEGLVTNFNSSLFIVGNAGLRILDILMSSDINDAYSEYLEDDDISVRLVMVPAAKVSSRLKPLESFSSKSTKILANSYGTSVANYKNTVNTKVYSYDTKHVVNNPTITAAVAAMGVPQALRKGTHEKVGSVINCKYLAQKTDLTNNQLLFHDKANFCICINLLDLVTNFGKELARLSAYFFAMKKTSRIIHVLVDTKESFDQDDSADESTHSTEKNDIHKENWSDYMISEDSFKTYLERTIRETAIQCDIDPILLKFKVFNSASKPVAETVKESILQSCLNQKNETYMSFFLFLSDLRREFAKLPNQGEKILTFKQLETIADKFEYFDKPKLFDFIDYFDGIGEILIIGNRSKYEDIIILLEPIEIKRILSPLLSIKASLDISINAKSLKKQPDITKKRMLVCPENLFYLKTKNALVIKQLRMFALSIGLLVEHKDLYFAPFLGSSETPIDVLQIKRERKRFRFIKCLRKVESLSIWFHTIKSYFIEELLSSPDFTNLRLRLERDFFHVVTKHGECYIFRDEIQNRLMIEAETQELLDIIIYGPLEDAQSKAQQRLKAIGAVSLYNLLVTSKQKMIVITGNSYDCFISHAWGKARRAHYISMFIATLLSFEGITSWFDECEMTDNMKPEMIAGIESSKIFLGILTEKYVNNINHKKMNNCKFEFEHAVKKAKRKENMKNAFRFIQIQNVFELFRKSEQFGHFEDNDPTILSLNEPGMLLEHISSFLKRNHK